MRVIVILLALLGYIGAPSAAQAAGSDSCSKDCRDYQRACLKAHSQDACKTDYDICMKACRKKQTKQHRNTDQVATLRGQSVMD
jgi:hypothetical protein